MSVQLKDPAAQVDASIAWAAFLDGAELIVSSSWVVDQTAQGDITVLSSSFDPLSAMTTAIIGGGRVGGVYEIRNTIVTSDQHTYVRSVTVRVESL